MTSPEHLPPEHLASFIDQVLKTKDPAAVGLKRILKKREDEKNDYPLRNAALEEFHVSGGGAKKLSADEQHILELEKKVADLQVELKLQAEKANSAIQGAYTKGKKEGREGGREDGLKTATEAYEKKIDQMQQRIEAMLQELERSKKQMFHNTEHLLLQLCIEMTKKIVRREVTEHNDTILAVLRHAMSFIGLHEKMVVRVAPGDLEVVSGRKDFWAPVGERLTDISIVPDEQIEAGGCILETNSGVVDARLGVQLSEIEELIKRTWNDIHSAIIAGEGNAAPEELRESAARQVSPAGKPLEGA